MAAQRMPLLQSSHPHGDDEESQRLSARRPASPAESIADACGVERQPLPLPAKQAAEGDGDGPQPIFVRTSGGPRARRQKPVENTDACCNCTPICRFLGLRGFPPCKNCWCVRDVCGLVCASFTWLLILYAEFVVVCVMLLPSPSPFFRWINGAVFHFFSSLALMSHWKAMFSNPGAIPLGNATRENILRMGYRGGQVIYKCPSCCSIKPDRAHHCSVCRRCIRKMDHHCPWVNNCVGESNQKYFVLFTLYICIISFYAIYMSIHFFVICIGSDWEECKSGYSPPFTTVFIVFLIVEAILFGLFTSIMCGEQIQAIWNDETGIESLKKEQTAWERKSRWVSMEAVFGHPFSWRWFSPLSPPNALPRHNDAFTYTSYYAV